MFKKERWSPYLVGALLGGLVTFVYTMGSQLWTSTGIARIAAVVTDFLFPSYVNSTPYFSELTKNGILFDIKILFVIALMGGAFVAYFVSDKTTKINDLLWRRVYGNRRGLRYLFAVLGGILLMVGARLAGGCTTGHAISGGSTFSLMSWVFMGATFAAAIPLSLILYTKKGR